MVERGVEESGAGTNTHIEIRDVGGTFFISFNGVVQCSMDYSGHVLSTRTDRDVSVCFRSLFVFLQRSKDLVTGFSPFCVVDLTTHTRWLETLRIRFFGSSHESPLCHRCLSDSGHRAAHARFGAPRNRTNTMEFGAIFIFRLCTVILQRSMQIKR